MADRIRSAAARRLRAFVLARDGYRCQNCGGHATEAGHIIPILFAPERQLDPANLRALCRPCNLGERDRSA